MKLIKSKKANINYLAKVVNINTFTPHPNPEVTKLKCAHVDGFNIIVGIDEKPGIYIYFPTSSQINDKLLSYANLYRHTDKNSNPEKSGFFEDNGRVKAIKLKGLVSEGFLLPYDILSNFIVSSTNKELDQIYDGIEFDSVEDNGKEFWICKKYIIKQTQQHGASVKAKQPKGISKIVENQFRFHYETCQYKRNPYFIKPDDYIHISSKIHGTSHISANVICQFRRSWFKRFLINIYNLFTRDDVDANVYQQYDNLYASRTVVKNAYPNQDTGGYYKCNVWGEADKILRPVLQKGMTIYAEIVGFLPDGNYIQKNYDYGCIRPESNETYTHEKHFKVRVYRITLTNIDGQVHEFSPREVQIWCNNNGLVPVTELYYGKAKDLYKDIDPNAPNWNEQFIDRLANDKNFYMELNSPDCVNKVPHEGIVLKVDNMIPAAVKLKSFAFLNGEQAELDKGVENIEDNA